MKKGDVVRVSRKAANDQVVSLDSVGGTAVCWQRERFCTNGCKNGVDVYVDGDGYDCPTPCKNCN